MATRKELREECKKVLSFIDNWQKETPYNPNKLREHNEKFIKDFTQFCKEENINDKERDFYLNK